MTMYHNTQEKRSTSSDPLFNSPEQRKKILHYLLLISAPIVALSCVPDFIYGIWESLYFLSYGLFWIAVSYYFNSKGKTDLAGHIIVLNASVLLFVQGSIMGPEALIGIFYLPIIIALAFVFDNTKRLQLAFHATHLIVFLILLQYADTNFLRGDDYNPATSAVMGRVNIIAALILCFFFVFVIIYYNQRSQAQLMSFNLQLENQNTELSKVNKELDQLVYSISHDLRSPVASALGLTELIRKDPDESYLRQYNDLTRDCLLRLDQHIRDLLDYLKNNRMEILPQRLSPLEEINSVVLLNQPYHTDVKVNVLCDVGLSLYTDRSRFKIIINNIISNAFRYMKPEGKNKSVTVSVTKEVNGVIIKIHDNGVGIKPMHKERIFDMFYRVDESTQGSGLGLYITKEAVSKLGGSISIDSEHGKYTEFSIYLPDLKTV
jgi:signal transduction histidine kinase